MRTICLILAIVTNDTFFVWVALILHLLSD